MLHGNVMNKLLNKYCLTNSGTTKQTNLTTLCIRLKKVNNLNTCLKNFYRNILLFEFWSRSVYVPSFLRFRNGFTTVNRITKNIKHTSDSSISNWNTDTSTSRCNFHVSGQSIAGSKDYTSNYTVSQHLSYFHSKFVFIHLYL